MELYFQSFDAAASPLNFLSSILIFKPHLQKFSSIFFSSVSRTTQIWIQNLNRFSHFDTKTGSTWQEGFFLPFGIFPPIHFWLDEDEEDGEDGAADGRRRAAVGAAEALKVAQKHQSSPLISECCPSPFKRGPTIIVLSVLTNVYRQTLKWRCW